MRQNAVMSVLRDPVGWWEGLGRPFTLVPRWAALALLVATAAVMAWAAATVAPVAEGTVPAEQSSEAVPATEGDGDLALYTRISDRVRAGEDYYHVALAEQRASNYPTKPFVTVRQPTLAMAHRWIGVEVLGYILIAALLILLFVLIKRLEGRSRLPERIGAALAVVLGGVGLTIPQAPMIHEVVAGICLGLALLLYSPNRWWPALLLAGLALAVRELSLPFVLLWLAFAISERRWTEAKAVAGLLLLFAAGMYVHYLGVEAARLPGDQASPGWNAMSGIILPFSSLAKLSAIPFVPKWLVPSLMVLPLLGWLGLGGRLGLFAAIWFAGFFTLMALFARPENFYWVQVTLPAYMAGFAFVPRALADLTTAIRGRKERLI